MLFISIDFAIFLPVFYVPYWFVTSRNLRLQNLLTLAGTPLDFTFNDSLFFDSIYHLNRQGGELRTAKIIELLCTLK